VIKSKKIGILLSQLILQLINLSVLLFSPRYLKDKDHASI